MAKLMKTQGRAAEPVEVVDSVDEFGAIDRSFGRMFGLWSALMPLHRPMLAARQWLSESFIPVDEFHQDDQLVIKAELPGVDPDKDVEVTVSDGTLRISAERRDEKKTEGAGYTRQEITYGSFARTLPLPKGVTEADVTATYKDGILEIHIPDPQPEPGKKIPITTA